MKREVKSIFLYPPEQNWPDTMCKPNGSLAYPYLAGAVLRYGSEATIYDACVGNDSDDLWGIFNNPKELESGMLKTGVSDERILSVVKDYDIVGLTSIFSHQETMVLKTASLIKDNFPEKIIVSGGVNARNRTKKFFDAGISIICASESERTIIEIVRVLENKSLDFSEIPNIYIRKEGENVVIEMEFDKENLMSAENGFTVTGYLTDPGEYEELLDMMKHRLLKSEYLAWHAEIKTYLRREGIMDGGAILNLAQDVGTDEFRTTGWEVAYDSWW